MPKIKQNLPKINLKLQFIFKMINKNKNSLLLIIVLQRIKMKII